METAQKGPDLQRVERLILEMARVFNWISLYQAGHPSLAGRVEDLHRGLVSQISEEPTGHLLFGIAKDKILYRNAFLEDGHDVVRHFTMVLFLRHVATLDLSGELTPAELLSFFLCLQRLHAEKGDERMEDLLAREGVKGIRVHPFNYKEVLSRRIVDSSGEAPSANREDELWRMLLTENVSAGGGDAEGPEVLSIPPELVPAILRRAYDATAIPGAGRSDPSGAAQAALWPEMVQRVLPRLGELLRKLPAEQRGAILRSLEARIGDGGTGDGDAGKDAEIAAGQAFLRTLTDSHTDDEFLDLLASFLAAEEKGGQRIRKIFEVIAADRDQDGTLLPRVQGRLGESIRTKNYFAQRAWEAVERLLLSRTEEAYIGRDHSRLLEKLSAPDAATQAEGKGTPPADPSVLVDFEEWSLHRKGAGVLLELLAEEESEGEFLELLEEVRKLLPNLASRKEFPLLRSILSTLTSVNRNAPENRKPSIHRVIGEVDFAAMMDQYLSPALSPEEKEEVGEILASFVEVSIGDFLDRLLMEPGQSNRRVLLSLAFRFDRRAIPAIRERLGNPQWYYVRNLCLILGQIGGPEVSPDLIRLLDHDDPRVRREAIQALGKLRAQDAVPSLGKILLHETLLPSAREESLRIEAATALFRCGGTKGVSYLHRGAGSRRAKVRAHCATLIRTLETRR
ncbi:MAG: HEAT repeat domain-containing protein [Deltaproteobacteria bacterium]|nr:MAG: HEAT repeat domain-containing protein [Deltaproteobacteria bacterium]